MQSVPITTNVASLNATYGEVYSIQLYVFVSAFQQNNEIESHKIGLPGKRINISFSKLVFESL
jgi:hypothetical protein